MVLFKSDHFQTKRQNKTSKTWRSLLCSLRLSSTFAPSHIKAQEFPHVTPSVDVLLLVDASWFQFTLAILGNGRKETSFRYKKNHGIYGMFRIRWADKICEAANTSPKVATRCRLPPKHLRQLHFTSLHVAHRSWSEQRLAKQILRITCSCNLTKIRLCRRCSRVCVQLYTKIPDPLYFLYDRASRPLHMLC